MIVLLQDLHRYLFGRPADFLQAAKQLQAGVPIEAVEQDETIDLTSLLIQPDCFLLKIKGDSMINSGILDGDLVVEYREQ